MRDDDHDFENEVLRVARALWPEAQYSGPVNIDGRERDGVFETEDCFHLVEATTSHKLDKAKQDVTKLAGLAVKFQKNAFSKAVRCWFVTRDEPTADQRHSGDKHKSFLTILGFAQFQSKIVDVRAYLSARNNYAFGSVRDPVTGNLHPAVGYVPLALAEPGTPNLQTPDEVVDSLSKGRRVVLLGDYGAGKSMTIRYLHHKLAVSYQRGESAKFPICINLRDHFGQVDPAEILDRHARTIGFDHSAHLVRAWRAGYVTLLLDGFDELTGLSVQGLWRKLRDNRYRAMEGIRRFAAQHPSDVGLVVTGRAHFFDTDAERKNALGLGPNTTELTLNEFSDEQLQQYLQMSKLPGSVPSWLPSRPLLVAYLASRGLLEDVVGQWAAGLDPASGWDLLLDRVTQREAAIEAGIDGTTVRRILERLATKSRRVPEGLGPLGVDDLVSAFREVCGYPPDDRGMVLLQRLPGLGVDSGESETRRFIDESFAEACRSGDIRAFVDNPFEGDMFSSPLECATGPLGVSLVASKIVSVPNSKINTAIQRAGNVGNQYLAADLVLAAIEAGQEIKSDIYIKDVLIQKVEFPDVIPLVANVHFQDCWFAELSIGPETDAALLPRFHNCFIGVLDGRISSEDLPGGVFDGCIVDEFSSGAGTTNQVLDLPLSLGVRVLLTVLMKLFERRGRGRRENSLYRGLDHRARRLVPDVLQLLKAAGVALPCRRGMDTIWLPDRSARTRAGKIIASPSAKTDPLVVAASKWP